MHLERDAFRQSLLYYKRETETLKDEGTKTQMEKI